MEVDQTVEVTRPAVAAGVVGQLRLDETADHGDDAIDVALVRDARFAQQLGGPVERLLGEGVRLRRGSEVGNMPLEQQLAPSGVFQREIEELPQVVPDGGTGITVQAAVPHDGTMVGSCPATAGGHEAAVYVRKTSDGTLTDPPAANSIYVLFN